MDASYPVLFDSDVTIHRANVIQMWLIPIDFIQLIITFKLDLQLLNTSSIGFKSDEHGSVQRR